MNDQLYYEEEVSMYLDNFYSLSINEENAKALIKTIGEKFGLYDWANHIDIKFIKISQSGEVVWIAPRWCDLVFPKSEFQLGLLIHEIAHIYRRKKYGRSKDSHDELHKECVREIDEFIILNDLREKHCIDKNILQVVKT